jgi:hypothetical protein
MHELAVWELLLYLHLIFGSINSQALNIYPLKLVDIAKLRYIITGEFLLLIEFLEQWVYIIIVLEVSRFSGYNMNMQVVNGLPRIRTLLDGYCS